VSDSEPNTRTRHRGANRLVLGALFAAFFIVAFWDSIFVPIKSGEQGVYWSRFFGGTSNRIIGEGTQLKFPWDEIAIYSTRIQNVSQTTKLLTRDGLEVGLTWAVRFHLNPRRIPEIHRMIGPDYITTNLIPQIISVMREVVGDHTAEEIYTLPEHELLGEVEKEMHGYAFRSGRMVRDDLFFLAIDLPDTMENAIIGKLINEQKMLAYRYRLRTEEDEKKRKEIEAQGIKAFQEISGVSILKWQAIEVTRDLGKSPNAKLIFMGASANALPVLLNADPKSPEDAVTPAAPPSSPDKGRQSPPAASPAVPNRTTSRMERSR
jgi:prohibitin 1